MFFSSCGRKHGVPLNLQQGPQHWDPLRPDSPCPIRSLHMILFWVGSPVLAPSISGTRFSVASGKSSLHASCEGPLRIPLKLVPGARSSSRVDAGTSGFLFSADMDLEVPMEFQQGSQASSRVETSSQFSSRAVKVVSDFLSS